MLNEKTSPSGVFVLPWRIGSEPFNLRNHQRGERGQHLHRYIVRVLPTAFGGNLGHASDRWNMERQRRGVFDHIAKRDLSEPELADVDAAGQPHGERDVGNCCRKFHVHSCAVVFFLFGQSEHNDDGFFYRISSD